MLKQGMYPPAVEGGLLLPISGSALAVLTGSGLGDGADNPFT